MRGIIKERPEAMKNPKILTGNIELEIRDLKVLAESRTHPFDIKLDGYEINEELRLKKRYLDLKRSRLHQNLKQRHLVLQFIRNYLTDKGFMEIETPYLSKTTPEGARDFLVPSRLSPGQFYALPQSPQQYKQLLMISQFEKYFQIVRCFRDEDPRGDRQAEFTQFDLEASFYSQDQILELIEQLIQQLVYQLYPAKKITQVPFPRITYKEAMAKYRCDRPDIRVNKNDVNELGFAFIVDFPMFEWHEKQYNEEAHYSATHHPFTKINFDLDLIKEDKIRLIKEAPESLRAWQYDIALNGIELGGGSIRETDPDILEAVFNLLGNNHEVFVQKFGHLREAFQYGVPPHGGIALGIDRFLMILQNEETIREVIAFPKTGDNRDLMMDAPSAADEKQLKELHLKIIDH